ncbi:hypothetical protein BDF22DRAFT_693760 [Syncephalis plumigaleata]|nr:hypothetical protein BDF22DRAFT_693760 [Syncephalis plumigaleata]
MVAVVVVISQCRLVVTFCRLLLASSFNAASRSINTRCGEDTLDDKDDAFCTGCLVGFGVNSFRNPSCVKRFCCVPAGNLVFSR